MTGKKNIKKIEPNISSVDIYENIVISDNSLLPQIERLVKSIPSTEMIHLGGMFFSIQSKGINIGDFDSIADRIEDAKKQILQIQTQNYDTKPIGQLPKNISTIFAQQVVAANKKFGFDREKMYMSLRSIFLNLYEHPETATEVVTEKDIDNLVLATTATSEDDAENNLNDACNGLARNISKLMVSWIYDQLCIPIFNYHTDKQEISTIQDEDKLLLSGEVNEKISLVTRSKGNINVLYEPTTNTLRTYNLGKNKFSLIFPFMFLTQVDQIVFHIRIEIFNIIKESMTRIIKEVLHDLSSIDLYDNTSSEELELVKESMGNSVEFFYRMSADMVNKARIDNRNIKNKYRRDNMRILANRILVGQVSRKILKMTPIVLFEELDEAVNELDSLRSSFSHLSAEINSHMGAIIEAKKEQNPSLYKKCVKNLRDFLKDVIVEVIDKKTGG